MTASTFDALAAARDLEAASLDRRQAEAGDPPMTKPKEAGREITIEIDSHVDDSTRSATATVHHEPLTVAALIEALRQAPQDALVVTVSGDASYGFCKAVETGDDDDPLHARYIPGSHLGGDCDCETFKYGKRPGQRAVFLTPYPDWDDPPGTPRWPYSSG